MIIDETICNKLKIATAKQYDWIKLISECFRNAEILHINWRSFRILVTDISVEVISRFKILPFAVSKYFRHFVQNYKFTCSRDEITHQLL